MTRCTDSLGGMFSSSIRANWALPALTEYGGETMRYADLAHVTARLHELFREAGVVPGDKVALIGRNSINWVAGFFSVLTYGAVVVPILHEFKASNVYAIVEHCEAKLLLASQQVWETLEADALRSVGVVVVMEGWEVKVERSGRGMEALMEGARRRFAARYPNGVAPDDVEYYDWGADDLVEINYTSGTSGNPKGVMIACRALMSNVEFAEGVVAVKPGDRVLSVLPMAHVFGQAFDFIYPLGRGVQVYMLSKMPTPSVVISAFKTVRPRYILLVPLVLEKIYKTRVQPKLRSWRVRFLLRVPVLRNVITRKYRRALTAAFGDEFHEVIVGGAALNPEVERFLKRIRFRYSIGYGMTECGPAIGYASWSTHKRYSAGRAVPNMEMRISGATRAGDVGEIEVRGANLMLGYYRRPEATSEVMREDGWMRTGDLGELDRHGNLTIRGRSKSMILGPGGQNIYPEELEALINSLPYVRESLVVEEGSRLVGMVVWEKEACAAAGMTLGDFQRALDRALPGVNAELPRYSQLAELRARAEEFKKTPKQSIKRYLYQLVKPRH